MLFLFVSPVRLSYLSYANAVCTSPRGVIVLLRESRDSPRVRVQEALEAVGRGMAPHPEQVVVMHAGLRPSNQPALRKPSNGELDEERKQELIMEKRLRACRVSIIPKVSKVKRVKRFITFLFVGSKLL